MIPFRLCWAWRRFYAEILCVDYFFRLGLN